ncbi:MULTISPECIES: DNA-J related domain-containing protein [unclassified Motilimonas]|uniref:DNA-J related domain-containing protein n=1 Tax=unclassified Motilimonas TaxID=2643697 RepID=UPI001E2A58F1|nr:MULTISPECIES: DNA-J related domain-containing protein [unclassified Motilimonas]MCE0558184.1 DnaJ domain-containing protein [Motilimonas sp. E26]MDO6526362.1 DNA-J related domain-containing protein [Motilimonas sp. 1_MG-2023]
MENPFIEPIFELLLNTQQPLKIHDIGQALKPLQQAQLDDDPNSHLFKLNFLIMNALYQLQDELINEYYLQISSLHIELLVKPERDIQLVNTSTTHNLKAYYLDWQNYLTSNEEIAQLLAQFWQQFQQQPTQPSSLSEQQALELFQLNEDATFAEIKQRWRELALIYHPDRGYQSPEKFKQYHAAWQALKNIHVCIS